ncbi:MAG TPA: phosphomethylpyrimidine synthase [Fervidobacterium sp.]|nr:phosphomethylpyrimidine synthase [Fervidobacterium sp.]
MTQWENAIKSIITQQMEICARNEDVAVEQIIRSLKNGLAVIPANRLHTNLTLPSIIGKGFRVKVNANIGTSFGHADLKEELEKLKVAIETQADSVMDLSTWGDLREIRKEILKNSPIPVGSVPIYSASVKAFDSKKSVIDFTEEDFINMVLSHAEDGIDFMTIHAGITNRTLQRLRNGNRILKMVSRGGAIITGWMLKNGKENPFYEHFDEILDIAHDYDVTISLGDGMRPGSIIDATDPQQIEELLEMQELVERAWGKGVQVMIEGPGHVPLNEIEANVKLMKKIGKGAPIFLLGPLPTDRGVGYDHIVGAIGGALAGYFGCDFLCYVTPSEHVSLPDIEDVREGIVASRIAATVADVAKRSKKALELEKQMAVARVNFNWEKMFELAIDSRVALEKYSKRPYDDKGCSMCGPFCAIKVTEEFTLKGT